MREVPASITEAWTSGVFVGNSRPMARVTIQKLRTLYTQYTVKRVYASTLFGQNDIPKELPNVKSVKWERSVGSDVATCTIELYNTKPILPGTTPEISGDFGSPGYYTFNRGATTWSATRWGQETNRWQDYLVPDRLIRTYEGYGFDRTVAPENDNHLVQTGVWMIDDVEYSSQGLITLSCRDVGRLLLDHIMFPPVIPLARYPIKFRKYYTIDLPDIVTSETSTSGTTFRPSYETDSGVPYNGKNGSIHGHKPSDAFDGKNGTYWLSVGNGNPHADTAFEYIQGKTSGRTIKSVTFKVWGGPYRCYLSIKKNGKWQGKRLIPYDEDDVLAAPNGANIHYVKAMTVDNEATATFTVNYTDVDSVRLSFTDLYNSGIGPFKYRAGVREFRCSSVATTTKKVVTDGGTKTGGNYGDYTEIVKWFLVYGGFFWPKNEFSYFTDSTGTQTPVVPDADDPYLLHGKVWGDLQLSGTAGVADLTADIFDKKPLMDGIAYVRDILGFVFFIDETGGAIFRMPNIWKVGNVQSNLDYTATRVSTMIELDEKQTLLGLRSKLTSRSIRENVFVATTTGKYGAVAQGYNPITPNPRLRRVAGWTDQHFGTTAECRKMADLITVRQMFEFRTDQIQILANPAIQIDDQIKIWERVTNDGYIHYVKGITSNNDLESGQWTYDIDAHWLGEEPGVRWAFNPDQLSLTTREYLSTMGAI